MKAMKNNEDIVAYQANSKGGTKTSPKANPKQSKKGYGDRKNRETDAP